MRLIVCLAALLLALPSLPAPAQENPAPAQRKKPRKAAPTKAPSQIDLSQRDDVKAFIAEMAQKHGFVESELAFLFSRTRHYPAIVDLITPPVNPRVRSWQTYRARFIEPVRIEGGVALWKKYAKELARAGVTREPAEGPLDFARRAVILLQKNSANPDRLAALPRINSIASAYAALRYGPKADAAGVRQFAQMVRGFSV